jgi:hypothetical protein
MTRRDWLSLGASLWPAGVRGQQTGGYPGVAYRQYAQCLPKYLEELALSAYQRRNDDLRRIRTPEDAAERRIWARQTFWNLVGGQPERSPLNARAAGTFERPGYRVEKVIYESRAGFHVTGNLYVPARGRPPYPAVLVQMGHAPAGKAYPSYQRLCQALVKLGFVVFGFDPMGQGERIYYPDATGRRTRTGSVDDEHSTAGRQMILTGDTATRLQTWDAVRAIDYLQTLSFVDRARIGTTGQSGGGTNSMLLLAADSRLAAAALCSANSENFACAGFNAPGSTDDAEQNLLDSGPVSYDRWDLIYPFAPKPLLVSVSDKDFFGTYSPSYISSGWEEFQKLRRIYELLEKPDQLVWGGTPLPHSLAYDTRLLVCNWFLRWFRGDPKGISEEPPTSPEPEETLYCTPQGSAVKDLGGLTPYLMNRRRRAGRQARQPLEKLLRLDAAPAAPHTVLRSVPSRDVEIQALEIPSGPHVFVPAWLFLPRPLRIGRAAMILLDPSGRNTNWHEDELYQTLAAQGFGVCVPDLRGIGDLAPEMSRGNPRYARGHNEEEAYAWAALILGKPLLGQRVSDLLAVIRMVKAHPALQSRSILLAAQGRLTVPAQCAAALSPQVTRLFASGGLISFRSVVDVENYGHPFANFIPGWLDHTDLPDITAQSQARHVTLAGMLDGGGRRLSGEEVKKTYEKTRSLSVLEQAVWNAEALARAAAV